MHESKAISRRTFLVRTGGAGIVIAMGGLIASCSSTPNASASKSSAAAQGSQAATSSSSAPAAGTQHVVLQQSYINNVEFAGYYVAAKKGYFQKYGLDVDIIPAGTTTDPRTTVANGKAQMGIVSETSDVLNGIAHGVPYKCFGAAFQENPGCLLVLDKSGIKGVDDLKGKTIGIQQNARQQVNTILQANHLTGQVNVTVVGDDPSPLVLGKIDAFTAFAFDEPVALNLKGIKNTCFSFSNIGLPGYGDNLIATDDTINKHPDMLAKFVRASQEGWQYAIDNPDDAVSISLKDYPVSGQNPAQQKGQMQVEIPMLTSSATKEHGLLWIDETVWANAIKAAQESHQLQGPVSVQNSLTQDILTMAKTVKPV